MGYAERDMGEFDAVVVGSGPNGLAAAVELARNGLSVVVIEAADTIGGGARSAELTLPGFVHDVCSAIHPLGAGSPFFRTVSLARHGLTWIHPDAPLAHPLDDGSAAVLERSVAETVRNLGHDGDNYRKLMQPLVDDWPKLEQEILGPLHIPRHPLALTRFGLQATRSAEGLARSAFKGKLAQALFAGLAAHSFLPLERAPSAAFGLVLGVLAHVVGWPIPEGGSQKISDALASYLREMGGRIVTGIKAENIDDLTGATSIVMLEITPRQFLHIAGHRLPWLYRRQLKRYRYGPGVFKIDWALDGPIPWRAKECRRAGTVHIGGTLEEIAAGEREVWRGRHPERPFVLLAQQSLFDETRAPRDKHTGWAYCHVPNGSSFDMTERIENQIERFAPGFRGLILARHVRRASDFESYNPNCIGGDINGGVQDFRQLFTRPVMRLNPYKTPVKGVYLCSASTPPGGGVHGMCGFHAARAAIGELKRRDS